MHGVDGHVLTSDQCVIGDEHFFLRGRLLLPIVDSDDVFDWGVWVSASRASFVRADDMWSNPARVDDDPIGGYLANILPTYEPSTLNLRARLHAQPVGQRPLVELEPTDHPLAVEQREGISASRIQALVERFAHPA
ncbi:hypothetical protein GCM10011591_33800 [Nocardia camponoti]|uniref:DUF2199 domain-containing protein n=2 Tax=Nocardia camponoti TaxID=1616106 RepID=A0A917QMS2_9NOCA|nr:hypothetical protein GCM10011591_33800 [Nocardia camponoti]